MDARAPNELSREPNSPTSAAGVSLKLLLVEDDDVSALVLSNLLSREGYQVERCADGTGALQMLERDRFQAVLLDLMMPGLDGMQVLKALRALPAHTFTPVIVVSAVRLELLEEEAH